MLFLLLLFSCSNIDFVLDTNQKENKLQNNTVVYVRGLESQALQNTFYKIFKQTEKKIFLLEVLASEKQLKRSVNENQVALKIDYEISMDYILKDTREKCPDFFFSKISRFSFTPKSSGYNFASDVLLKKLYERAILENINSFVDSSKRHISLNNCVDEG